MLASAITGYCVHVYRMNTSNRVWLNTPKTQSWSLSNKRSQNVHPIIMNDVLENRVVQPPKSKLLT